MWERLFEAVRQDSGLQEFFSDSTASWAHARSLVGNPFVARLEPFRCPRTRWENSASHFSAFVRLASSCNWLA